MKAVQKIFYGNIPEMKKDILTTVQQAIQNLLSNAIKFRSPERAPEMRIFI